MNKNLGLQKVILTTMITSLVITGVSFFDDKIWNIIMLVVGELAYCIVGILYSIHFLTNKQDGRDAYKYIFCLLLLGVYAIYSAIIKIQKWILSWHIAFKIIIPLLFLLIIVLTIINMIKSSKIEKSKLTN